MYASHTWTQKAYFVRYTGIVTPILLVHATRSKQAMNLINSDFINQVHRMIWQPTNDAAIFSETDDMFKIEMLHLTRITTVDYWTERLDRCNCWPTHLFTDPWAGEFVLLIVIHWVY
jgi:transformation/transcription domain-associated protein